MQIKVNRVNMKNISANQNIPFWIMTIPNIPINTMAIRPITEVNPNILERSIV